MGPWKLRPMPEDLMGKFNHAALKITDPFWQKEIEVDVWFDYQADRIGGDIDEKLPPDYFIYYVNYCGEDILEMLHDTDIIEILEKKRREKTKEAE